jgi:glycosyltransferase involved in cell wall biosynthesis
MSQSLVIVPTYNERENIPGVVEKLLALAAPVGGAGGGR